MPEGHTIHRLARDLSALIGPPLSACSPQGRFPDAKLIDGLPMTGTDAYGKHLLLQFDIGTVHIHLGMAGKFFRSSPPAEPRPAVRLRLATPDLAWDLVGPNRCELVDEQAVAALAARLGPDPLRPDADPKAAWSKLQRYRGSIGAALLDQTLIAGIGNVFRAEALFVLGISPHRPAAGLTRAEFDVLWDTVKSVMQRGVREGRIITVDHPPGPERDALPETEARFVYKQELCRRCASPVERSPIANRTAYACPRCQV